mgnify:CR=1 FL=1
MEMIVLFGTMFLVMLIGVPLGFAVGIAAIVAFIVFTDTPSVHAFVKYLTSLSDHFFFIKYFLLKKFPKFYINIIHNFESFE